MQKHLKCVIFYAALRKLRRIAILLINQSGASEHAKACESSFKWNGAETMAVESNYMRRKVREALEIRKSRQTTDATSLNRDQGNILTNSSWDVLLGKMASII